MMMTAKKAVDRLELIATAARETARSYTEEEWHDEALEQYLDAEAMESGARALARQDEKIQLLQDELARIGDALDEFGPQHTGKPVSASVVEAMNTLRGRIATLQANLHYHRGVIP